MAASLGRYTCGKLEACRNLSISKIDEMGRRVPPGDRWAQIRFYLDGFATQLATLAL